VFTLDCSPLGKCRPKQPRKNGGSEAPTLDWSHSGSHRPKRPKWIDLVEEGMDELTEEDLKAMARWLGLRGLRTRVPDAPREVPELDDLERGEQLGAGGHGRSDLSASMQRTSAEGGRRSSDHFNSHGPAPE